MVLIVSNFLVVDFFGSQIWSSASYFFGNNVQTTLGVLLFIESGILLALGSMWSLGSSENVSYGIYKKNYGSFGREDWENRKKLTENPGSVVKILLIVGGLALVAAFVSLVI